MGGLWQLADQLIAVLRSLCHEVTPRLLGTGPTGPVDLRVACVNADHFDQVDAGPPDVPLVGYWAWEVDRFPRRFAEAGRAVDAVWTLDEGAAEVLGRALDVPVQALPPAVPSPLTPASPRTAGTPFRCLVVADHRSGTARKNAVGSVRAYLRAFGSDDGARLVVKTSGGADAPGAHRRLQRLVADRPDVELVDRRLPDGEYADLLRTTDCLVSLHRAEGFGLALAEAMSAGAVVLATAHGGNLAFMGPHEAVLVPARLVHVGLGHWPYPPTARWAAPDEAAAARELRRLRADPSRWSRLSAAAARRLVERESVAARGPLVAELLHEVLCGARRPRRPAPVVGRPPARLLAGALHRADVVSAGRWVYPFAAIDGRRTVER